MKTTELVACPGDGIGPEIMAVTLELLQTANDSLALGLTVREADVGFASLAKTGSTVPDNFIELIQPAAGIILGPCDTKAYPPSAQGGINPSARLRLGLGLYANLRPSRVLTGLPAIVPQMDVLIARENTEGFLADRNMFLGPGEFMPTPDVAISLRKITVQGSRQIARAACEAALDRRKKLTIVTKVNGLKVTDGLFLREARAVAGEFPALEVNEMLVDAIATDLVRKPHLYDVIVTTNLFGDILSNEASGLCHGLGMAGSLNCGDSHAMGQSTHGSAPRIAGQNIANPCSLIFSTCLLLDWLSRKHQRADLGRAATLIDQAVKETVRNPKTRTADLGGSLGTRQFGEAVQNRLIALTEEPQ
jgi:3-isopropylmalate dehydrogenase